MYTEIPQNRFCLHYGWKIKQIKFNLKSVSVDHWTQAIDKTPKEPRQKKQHSHSVKNLAIERKKFTLPFKLN